MLCFLLQWFLPVRIPHQMSPLLKVPPLTLSFFFWQENGLCLSSGHPRGITKQVGGCAETVAWLAVGQITHSPLSVNEGRLPERAACSTVGHWPRSGVLPRSDAKQVLWDILERPEEGEL